MRQHQRIGKPHLPAHRWLPDHGDGEWGSRNPPMLTLEHGSGVVSIQRNYGHTECGVNDGVHLPTGEPPFAVTCWCERTITTTSEIGTTNSCGHPECHPKDRRSMTTNIYENTLSGKVWKVLNSEHRPWRVKEIARACGLIGDEKDVKDVSSRCIYLIKQGRAVRTDFGFYQAVDEKGRNMTDTGTMGIDQHFAGPIPSSVPIPETRADAPKPVCPECGFVSTSEMGLKAHMTRSHKKLGGNFTADQAFERTGRALEALFPDGIPMARLIEIAELQKQMLKAITR